MKKKNEAKCRFCNDTGEIKVPHQHLPYCYKEVVDDEILCCDSIYDTKLCVPCLRIKVFEEWIIASCLSTEKSDGKYVDRIVAKVWQALNDAKLVKSFS